MNRIVPEECVITIIKSIKAYFLIEIAKPLIECAIKMKFLFYQLKHMLWVLQRTLKAHFKTDGYEDNNNFMLKMVSI